eukprot:3785038-Pleurochrysis_carterae.AAC.1
MEQARARGLGRAWAVARKGGAQQAGAAIASVIPRTWRAERERSTSAPQVCMRCNAKTANCA